MIPVDEYEFELECKVVDFSSDLDIEVRRYSDGIPDSGTYGLTYEETNAWMQVTRNGFAIYAKKLHQDIIDYV